MQISMVAICLDAGSEGQDHKLTCLGGKDHQLQTGNLVPASVPPSHVPHAEPFATQVKSLPDTCSIANANVSAVKSLLPCNRDLFTNAWATITIGLVCMTG